MKYRILGKSGLKVSVIGMGTWQFGGDWGGIEKDEAMAMLRDPHVIDKLIEDFAAVGCVGEEASMLEAIAALERISGRTLDVRRVDPARGDVRRTKADVSRIRDALGWHPRVGLEDGLERMWAWASARVAAA